MPRRSNRTLPSDTRTHRQFGARNVNRWFPWAPQCDFCAEPAVILQQGDSPSGHFWLVCTTEAGHPVCGTCAEQDLEALDLLWRNEEQEQQRIKRQEKLERQALRRDRLENADLDKPLVDVDSTNLVPVQKAAEKLMNAHKKYSDYISDLNLTTSEVSMMYLMEVRVAADDLDREIKKVGLYGCTLTGRAETGKISAVDTIRYATRRLLQGIPDPICVDLGEVFLFDRRAIRDIEFATKGLQTCEPYLCGEKESRLKIPPELRTIPMTLKKAAQLMGYTRYRGDDEAVKLLRASITDGTVLAESLTRQQHIFSKNDFPVAVWPELVPTPPKSP